MVADMNGSFRRGLSDEFVSSLQVEAHKDGWWRDVLADRTLLIAIRDEYLNVYWRGQSLFEVRFNGKALAAWTHPKYLLNPSLSGLVHFDGREFRLGNLESCALMREYEDSSTLANMKKAAGIYANGEKIGVHAIATTNSSVIDVEIAFRNAGDEAIGSLPRLDIASFEAGATNQAHLVFWEAKLYGNKELRSNGGDIPVLKQIEKYRAVISDHRTALLDSYARVAGNLTAIADMSESARTVGVLIRQVASGERFLRIQDPADVGLIIFGFDQAQRDHSSWQTHRNRLKDEIGQVRLKESGDVRSVIV